MPEKILLCTDLDRTLLPNGKQPESPQARSLFAEFCRQSHVTLVYVSGRDKQLLLQAISEYDIPLPDYAIGDVGTSIYHIEARQWSLDPDWSAMEEADWAGRHRQDLQALLVPIEQLQPQEEVKQNTFKLSYYLPLDCDEQAITERMQALLKEQGIQANIIYSVDEAKNIGLVDVLPRAADKLAAIRFLSQTLRIPRQRIVFSGDSGNDLSVLTSDIPATLVANASEEVRQQALRMAKANRSAEALYLAQGNFHGMNGNYAAGILEGVHHYLQDTHAWFGARHYSRT